MSENSRRTPLGRGYSIAPRIQTRMARFAGPVERFTPAYLVGVETQATSFGLEKEKNSVSNELRVSDFGYKTPCMCPGLFARISWFHSQIVGDAKEVQRFAFGNFLQGKLPLAAMYKVEWRPYDPFDLAALHFNGKPMARARDRMEWEAFLEHIKRLYQQ